MRDDNWTDPGPPPAPQKGARHARRQLDLSPPRTDRPARHDRKEPAMRDANWP